LVRSIFNRGRKNVHGGGTESGIEQKQRDYGGGEGGKKSEKRADGSRVKVQEKERARKKGGRERERGGEEESAKNFPTV